MGKTSSSLLSTKPDKVRCEAASYFRTSLICDWNCRNQSRMNPTTLLQPSASPGSWQASEDLINSNNLVPESTVIKKLKFHIRADYVYFTARLEWERTAHRSYRTRLEELNS